MNHLWHASAGCFLILATLAGGAYTQNQQAPADEKSSTVEARLFQAFSAQLADGGQRRTYENIEIFRRLLLKTLTPFASGTKSNSADYYTATAAEYRYPQSNQQASYLQNYQKANDPHASVGIGPLPVEGVLLPSGIVMTAELPMPFSAPTKEPESKVKPLTDWDRAQRELNGEKIDPASEAKPVRPPNVLNAVLHTLAENGHKLSGLDTNQSVTLVLTFRGAWSQQCTACHINVTQASTQAANGQSTTYSSVDYSMITWPNAYGQINSGNKNAAPPGQGSSQLLGETLVHVGEQNSPGGQNYGVASDSNDQILGDLHFKQGRLQEALACYTKAGKQFHSSLPDSLSSLPNGPRRRELILRAIELQNKILQCEVALKHEDKVNLDVSQLKRWTSLLEGMEDTGKGQQTDQTAQAKKKGQSLPVKAIITASKELLDQVGEGHITFDQFKKKVSVNIVRFE